MNQCFNIRSTDEAGPRGNATHLCTRSTGSTVGWRTDYPYLYGIIQSRAPAFNYTTTDYVNKISNPFTNTQSLDPSQSY